MVNEGTLLSVRRSGWPGSNHHSLTTSNDSLRRNLILVHAFWMQLMSFWQFSQWFKSILNLFIRNFTLHARLYHDRNPCNLTTFILIFISLALSLPPICLYMYIDGQASFQLLIFLIHDRTHLDFLSRHWCVPWNHNYFTSTINRRLDIELRYMLFQVWLLRKQLSFEMYCL